jgi:glycerol transport system ATP-binding protein
VVECEVAGSRVNAIVTGSGPEKGAMVQLEFRRDQTRLYADGWLASEAAEGAA